MAGTQAARSDRPGFAASLGAAASLLIVFYGVLLFLRFRAGSWLLDPARLPIPIDFTWTWLAGHFALARDAASAYDFSPAPAAPSAMIGFGRGAYPHIHISYPPNFLLIAAPFALLPYLLGFIAWIAATLALYLLAVWAILPRPVGLLLALAPFAVVENLFLGQTGFLLAGLLGLSLALTERRPILAGLILGLLAYKPQYGVLFPIVLAVAGRWRVMAGATVSVCGMAAAATLAFGANAWSLYADAVTRANLRNFILDPNLDATLQTAFGILHWFGADPVWCWLAQLSLGAPVVVVTCVLQRLPQPYALKAAALALAVPCFTPYMLAYDLTTLTIPAAFLIRDALARGFLPGDKTVFLIGFMALQFILIGPIGPLVMGLLLFVLLRRVLVVPDGGGSLRGPVGSVSGS
jgi:hypothetical protein